MFQSEREKQEKGAHLSSSTIPVRREFFRSELGSNSAKSKKAESKRDEKVVRLRPDLYEK
ncbi:hypothetical protein EHQ53_04125 [Leptospira langatensis]|uniref:Uncharacterized protein n=1 Tax=Leptospira langatensis TaxID=2484983 RepID=A0A5F1ZVL1_9LEPT|nr:hypothetical protein [Leptospira langatensis]TGK00013.1 hypothetical protein EHO57_11990 [Leptospira langatensis]TGL42648.1 hypothetical protein EHQ53_04125 [Leptospira langatensis]